MWLRRSWRPLSSANPVSSLHAKPLVPLVEAAVTAAASQITGESHREWGTDPLPSSCCAAPAAAPPPLSPAAAPPADDNDDDDDDDDDEEEADLASLTRAA